MEWEDGLCDEVWLLIFTQASAVSTKMLSLTCKRLRHLMSSDVELLQKALAGGYRCGLLKPVLPVVKGRPVAIRLFSMPKTQLVAVSTKCDHTFGGANERLQVSLGLQANPCLPTTTSPLGVHHTNTPVCASQVWAGLDHPTLTTVGCSKTPRGEPRKRFDRSNAVKDVVECGKMYVTSPFGKANPRTQLDHPLSTQTSTCRLYDPRI
jgi:hypothetical protein